MDVPKDGFEPLRKILKISLEAIRRSFRLAGHRVRTTVIVMRASQSGLQRSPTYTKLPSFKSGRISFNGLALNFADDISCATWISRPTLLILEHVLFSFAWDDLLKFEPIKVSRALRVARLAHAYISQLSGKFAVVR